MTDFTFPIQSCQQQISLSSHLAHAPKQQNPSTVTLCDIQAWWGWCQDWDQHKWVQESFPALPINPVLAQTTQKKNPSHSNVNKRRNKRKKTGVGSTWKKVMAEVSLRTAGKWDNKHERRLKRVKEINLKASEKKVWEKIIEDYRVEDMKSANYFTFQILLYPLPKL